MSTDIADGSGLDTHVNVAMVYRKLRTFLVATPNLASDTDPAPADKTRYNSDVKRGLLLGILLMWLLSDHKNIKLEELHTILQKAEVLIEWIHDTLTGECMAADIHHGSSVFDAGDPAREVNLIRSLPEIMQYKNRLSIFRAGLASTDDLRTLISDPPTILLDKQQQLFFYRGVQIKLQPRCFSCFMILAENARHIVSRDTIYQHLWPGDMNYEGTNKPYERQVTDHKRRFVAQLKNGIAGKITIPMDELETLIITKPKVGYMLNVERGDVVILPCQ